MLMVHRYNNSNNSNNNHDHPLWELVHPPTWDHGITSIEYETGMALVDPHYFDG